MGNVGIIFSEEARFNAYVYWLLDVKSCNREE